MYFVDVFIEVAVGASLLMFVGWVSAVIRGRAEIVDVLWSLGTGAAGVWFAYRLDGDENRRLLLAALTGFWGMRLGIHLIQDRLLAPHEDGRYLDLRRSWGSATNKNLFIFFQLQAFLIPFLGTAAFAVASNQRPIYWYDYLSIIIAIIALTGEAIADRQLSAYKKTAQPGGICDVGLWSWTRHPNYFFEWMYWMSFPILAWGGDYFWFVILSPLLIFYLINYVTGIPPTEARMLERRGEPFIAYQKRVSAFWPRPPKKI
jgi:steroid 5-alpha reductase family enzyme